ncbi:MAG: YdcF family protein [Candidatus Goldbacteria bacterium]|nr:YdcF family protein [Candidatus Goldiibacteriota bacterium]
MSLVIYLFSIPFIWKKIICGIETKLLENISTDGDVIAVFGGGVTYFYDNIFNTKILDIYSGSRLFAAYKIHYKTHLPIILSGGYVFNQEAFGNSARDVLISLGVNEKYIHIDNLSRDTYENVKYIMEICKRNGYKKIIIISDAMHIPRISLLFENSDFKISFYPSSFLCTSYCWKDFLPGDILYSRTVFHEFLGYIWYRIFY